MDWEGGPKRGAFKNGSFWLGFLDSVEQEKGGAGGGGGVGPGGVGCSWSGAGRGGAGKGGGSGGGGVGWSGRVVKRGGFGG